MELKLASLQPSTSTDLSGTVLAGRKLVWMPCGQECVAPFAARSARQTAAWADFFCFSGALIPAHLVPHGGCAGVLGGHVWLWPARAAAARRLLHKGCRLLGALYNVPLCVHDGNGAPVRCLVGRGAASGGLDRLQG